VGRGDKKACTRVASITLDRGCRVKGEGGNPGSVLKGGRAPNGKEGSWWKPRRAREKETRVKWGGSLQKSAKKDPRGLKWSEAKEVAIKEVFSWGPRPDGAD